MTSKLIDNINKTIDFIAANFLLIFGLYSILYFIISKFKKNKIELIDFDNSVVELTIWIGTIWVILKLIGIIFFFNQISNEDESVSFSQHLSWFLKNSWFQLLFWIILSQLLRIKFFKHNLVPRILISFFFAFSFARINMILIKFHRDYVPNGKNFNFDISQVLFDLMYGILIFIIIVSIYYFGKRGLKNILQQRA